MERTRWWWAVYDNATGELISDPHATATVARHGKQARGAAEVAARNWLAALEPSVERGS
jgi:hypothetical protein